MHFAERLRLLQLLPHRFLIPAFELSRLLRHPAVGLLRYIVELPVDFWRLFTADPLRSNATSCHRVFGSRFSAGREVSVDEEFAWRALVGGQWRLLVELVPLLIVLTCLCKFCHRLVYKELLVCLVSNLW
ncbi:hypothetical protein M758_3G245300 [Ceratodon purpureus]|nr:hypothetical protein M758_3G245300 [Ceratodon purpureus]